ncbi:MOSC domain-containing protein [Rhodococcus aerolatus]
MLDAGVVVAVCVTERVLPDPGRVGQTGIDKRPAAGRVEVGPLGLAGDTVSDTRDHGGRDQAVYAYAREEADRWADELGQDVPPGRFGENLAVSGLAVTDAVVGERWRVGADRDDACVLEVTLPRTPCATFGRFLGQERWVRRFTERGDVGAYLRVVVPGTVGAGDPVEVVSRPAHGVTVRDLFTAREPGPVRALLTDGEDVPPKAVAAVEKLLARA